MWVVLAATLVVRSVQHQTGMCITTDLRVTVMDAMDSVSAHLNQVSHCRTLPLVPALVPAPARV